MTKNEVMEFINFVDVQGANKTMLIGDKVRYIPRHAQKDRTHSDCEVGVVTSIREKHCFVRYEKQHPESNGQATNYSDLELY